MSSLEIGQTVYTSSWLLLLVEREEWNFHLNWTTHFSVAFTS
jgi:hypothetical protein